MTALTWQLTASVFQKFAQLVEFGESMEHKLVKDGFCFVCGNHGFPDKDCTSCGREATNTSLNLDRRDDVDSFVTNISANGIPDAYKGVVWSSEFLKNTKPGKERDYNFQKFVSGLERVNNVFANGTLSRKSAIIIAPAGYSKMTFAYSCMQRAIDNGYSVAPLLDTVEIKRLLVLAAENPNYRLYGEVLYDEYVMSDVLFATVTKMKQREWAYETIQELIDRRARKGLATFIMSRYNLAEISKKDYANQFSAIATPYSGDDFKYPAVIKYEERNKGFIEFTD